MMRIVSLLPNATEIVCALGLSANLVGRSHECDYPPEVTHLPALTAPRFNPEGTSAEVDRRVKSILQNALSVYRVDADQLMALRPDVIVTQSQCEVCAVSERELDEALAQWMGGAGPAVVSLKAASLDGVFADIARAASALGVEQTGAQLIASLKERIERIKERAASAGSRPSLATIEWIDPLMSGGNWMPELIEMAGGRNLFGQAGSHSPWINFQQLAAANPDVILVSPCGFGIDRSLEELPSLTSNPEWAKLPAVRNGRVFIADGNQYFNRPGPRLVESLEIIAELLHPKVFSFGHEGTGWRPYR
ncbi:MAG TPA: cobalamin-binding protein [Candidatus Binataceae bacterium]|nr:cobalamin-binding protein [Candidatus Binataceae bacterium]